MEPIIKYIKEKYCPEAIIVYGSFADGSANENSDFDALIITDNVKTHDSSQYLMSGHIQHRPSKKNMIQMSLFRSLMVRFLWTITELHQN